MNHSELKIFGNAGVGKTHIACNICDNRLRNGLPALFVRGVLFTDDQSIGDQLNKKFGIRGSYNFQDFLQALSFAAEAYNTRIPLFIDGLNEATDNGTLSKVWEKYLKGFVHQIEQTKNVVLITTCRSSYKKVIWGDEYLYYSLDVEGFDTDEVTQEAIVKYSKAYNYNIEPNFTLAPLTQFKHPIYLKIYFDTKKRSGNTEEPDYIGEQALFEIFDEYLIVCNKAICDDLNRHKSASIVQTELTKIAGYLWTNRCRDIPFNELGDLVDGKPFDELDWETSKSQAILNEDLLVYKDWGQFGESVHFTYDLLGGYLIAKYLVERANDDVQGFINSEEVVGALFSEDYETLHPMHEDISRCLAALLPAKTDQFLHELSDNETAFSLSIRALFEISPQYICEDCVNLITHLFELPENRKLFLELAESTIGHLCHPLSASFWSDQLLALSMVERDLSWSEYIRLYRENFEKRLNRFEEACQSDQELSDSGKEHLHLMAEYIMWILTSTVRPLRDQATRALYWYGRRFPQTFFDLVMKSLKINDPYVSERMLAATYGIAMARQSDFEDTSFVTEILPECARQLYENMFKSDAPHATTHILARDYARRTIDLALIYHPDLLTEDERERITPPFIDGGIREWGECEDGDAGPYQGGAAPLQMDFGNYTLGRLVKDRGIYNFEHSEYKRVRANIFWRIYSLEYSLDSFAEIDSWLGGENCRKYSRSASGEKIDRYGKKYSWIAFYELAGFREDNGLLPDRYEDARISDADIDPSFPDDQTEYNLVTEGFLGDPEISAKDWIFNTPPPDLTSYLTVDQLCEEKGPWTLLWGSFSQENKKDSRDIFASFQGLIVKSGEGDKIVETLMSQETTDRSNMPFCPEDYYTYAGEVPWCDTYPENSTQEIQIEIGKVLVPERRVKRLRNDKPIPSEEMYELCGSIADLLEKADEETLKAWLRERNLKITIETGEVEETEYETFEVLVPVRENNWGDHRSAINSNRSVAIPSRQIAEALGLCGQPQSFDLFEKENGRLASITFQYGEKWGNTQHFTYLRQDLLERYLAEIDAELIWVIWGERRQLSQNPDVPYEPLQDAPYEHFQEVKAYSDIQKASGGS